MAPLLTGGRVRLGSKMGVTDMSSKMEEQFLAGTRIPYVDFCQQWLARGYTPVRAYSAPMCVRVTVRQ